MQSTPPKKINFSFAGNSPRPAEVRVEGSERRVVASQMQPVRVSPAQYDRRIVVSRTSPIRAEPEKRVIV